MCRCLDKSLTCLGLTDPSKFLIARKVLRSDAPPCIGQRAGADRLGVDGRVRRQLSFALVVDEYLQTLS